MYKKIAVKKHSVLFTSVLSALFICSAFISSAFYAHRLFLKRSRIHEASLSGIRHAQRIDDEIGNIISTVRILAQNRNIRDICKGTLPVDDPGVLCTLKTIQTVFEADLVYIFNIEGTVIASTVYEGISLTGNNYAFRPYFSEAKKGKCFVYPAVGVTTGARGLYLSAPVIHEGIIYGVTTVKLNAARYDTPSAHEHSIDALISEDGIIFAANNPDWVLRSTLELSNDKIKEIKKSRQFSDADLPLLGINLFSDNVLFHHTNHTVVRTPLAIEGWSIVSLIPDTGTRILSKNDTSAFRLVTASTGLLLLVIWLLFFIRILHRENENKLKAAQEINTTVLENTVLSRTAELLKINKALNYEIAQRKTAETNRRIAEENLIHAEKMNALGLLAGGIAHDFNNQLTGIIGFAEMLTRRVEGSAHEKFTQKILEAAQRSADLIKKLQIFSRKTKIIKTSTDIMKIVKETAAILERSIDPRITVTLQNASVNPFVSADPGMIQNALLNLCINARDAMPEGGVLTIRIEDAQLSLDFCILHQNAISPGRYLCIIVSDTGTGMTDEIKKRIFEPFFTTKPEGKGTGMGLVSVYSAVQNHHGVIEVETHPGGGTMFRMYFPAENPEDTGSTPPVRETAKISTRAHILIADDDELIRQLYSDIMTESGHTITACKNGKECAEYYSAHFSAVDLIILDMSMPVMNGKDTFDELVKINKDCKVLIASGYAPGSDVREMLLKPGVVFLQKPFTLSQLRETIHKMLSTGSFSE